MSALKILVIGANGMVGRALTRLSQGDQITAFTREQLDISDDAAVTAAIQTVRPRAVINCAALTDVDACESDRSRAHQINAIGPLNLARACRRNGATLVTISTDYVFDGTKEGFYTQRDDPNPQSVYAMSKLEGERLAASECARTMIVRTGWIFGAGGKNFLSRVVELAIANHKIVAINDSYGTPTFADDLAMRLRQLAEIDIPGIYHVAGSVSSGRGVSFAEFTYASLKLARLDASNIKEVSMNSLKRPAPRPRSTPLKCLMSELVGLAPLRHWHDALAEFVAISNNQDHKK